MYGLIGGVVGASFAVLVAEELFASGCGYLLSITSAGQIAPVGSPPYFILIDRALRDEGTSYHYLPPARYAEADPKLVDRAQRALADVDFALVRGSTWTTDPPFRETAATIADRQAEGVLAVEMEAAALYAFAMARRRAVLCFAHVTNQMGRVEGDFEKGGANGTRDALPHRDDRQPGRLEIVGHRAKPVGPAVDGSLAASDSYIDDPLVDESPEGVMAGFLAIGGGSFATKSLSCAVDRPIRQIRVSTVTPGR